MKTSTDTPIKTLCFLRRKALHMLFASVACLLTTFSIPQPEAIAGEDFSDYTLDKVVVLMRHGVRPQNDTAKLDQATGKNWPRWSVPDGNLSGHGYAGIVDQSHLIADEQTLPGILNREVDSS